MEEKELEEKELEENLFNFSLISVEMYGRTCNVKHTFISNRTSGLSVPYKLMASLYLIRGKGILILPAIGGQEWSNKFSTRSMM